MRPRAGNTDLEAVCVRERACEALGEVLSAIVTMTEYYIESLSLRLIETVYYVNFELYGLGMPIYCIILKKPKHLKCEMSYIDIFMCLYNMFGYFRCLH